MPQLPCVLLVDDDETTNYLNHLLLKRMDIAAHILVAINGRQALDLLLEHCPEPTAPTCPVLILLDINMPVMNGFEFLEAYAQLPQAQRDASVVLMLTTSLNPRDAERLRTLPAAGILAKPLSRVKVVQLLQEHFGFPLLDAPMVVG